jgi:hypothetical protein
MTEAEAAVPRYVTITHFLTQMLGRKSRGTYYNHVNDPGWPQRVMIGGKPMLNIEDCLNYIRRQDALGRTPPAKVKRPRGRPRKVRK